ncbi:MAG: DUF721 domain-containing protein [Bdellovibrionales bacterium]|nr:DUF721 domain-containing protein [Bdellovibrionales bacterium]
MFKKIDYKRLNYGDLDRIDSHDIKRDEMHSFFLTFDFLDLIKKWPEIVGVKLAAVTSPLKIKQDSLFVITKHSSYSQELSFSAEMIKKEVFKQFPNLKPIIKKLAFQTQENFFEQKLVKEKELAAAVPKLHPQSPKYKILKLEAERLFNDVEDSELKESLISIFIQSK